MGTLNDRTVVDGNQFVLAAYYNLLLGSILRKDFTSAVTMSGDLELTDGDYPIQRLNCNGANRVVKVPPSGDGNHPFLVMNTTSVGAWTLTVKSNDTVTTHKVLDPGKFGFFVSDGNGGYVEIGAGVSDHGALTGLADDDHAQYHNDARGDARYPKKYANKIAAPTVNDDSGDGYAVGDRWLDETNDKEYVALDVTAGAAVWTETTGAGGGKILQDLTTINNTYSSIVNPLPFDDTIPQSTEGGEILSRAITPSAVGNKIKVRVVAYACSDPATTTIAVLFQNGTAVAAGFFALDSSNRITPIVLEYSYTATGTSQIPFTVRAGNNSGPTTYVNGRSGGRVFGGVLISSINVQEKSA